MTKTATAKTTATCDLCHQQIVAGEKFPRRRRRDRPYAVRAALVPQQLRPRVPPVTAADLRKAEARYQRAFRRAEEARGHRNAAVRAALDAGWTHQQIANATGLTRGRIGQIAMQRGS